MQGSMMGPHWNSMDTEIVVVLEGWGMVRVVCSSISRETDCRNVRFEVEEGDAFAVPRFCAMAQMAFNNGTFAFMGFSTITERNEPHFLAGEASVLRTLGRDVLAMSFNVTNTTVDELLAPQDDVVIAACTSCAEEELRIMEEEMEEEAGEREGEGETEAEAGRQQGGEKERQQEEPEESETEEAGQGGGGGGGGGKGEPESKTEEEEQGGGGSKGGPERGTEEEEQGGGGGGGKGEPRGTELQHEIHDDHDKWGRRIAKNKKRSLTV